MHKNVIGRALVFAAAGLGSLALVFVLAISSAARAEAAPGAGTGARPPARAMVVLRAGPEYAAHSVDTVEVVTGSDTYGGQIVDVAASSVTSHTAFAVAKDLGLFRTQDSGGLWSIARVSAGGGQVVYGPPPTPTLYFRGDSAGLWSSLDDGGRWYPSVARFRATAFAVAPSDGAQLWVATPDGKIYRSLDAGIKFTPTQVISSGIYATRLVVAPSDSSVGYAAFSDGGLQKTIDHGASWTPLAADLPVLDADHPMMGLAIDPAAKETILLSRMNDSAAALYKSIDGGQHWGKIQTHFVSTGTADSGYFSDFAFSPVITSTVYGSMVGVAVVAVSRDAGSTWSVVALRSPNVLDGAYSIALDPGTGLPAYLGGWSKGVYRTKDGGSTWELATDGIPLLVGRAFLPLMAR